MKINVYRLKGRFKGFLFIVAISIILSLLYYTQRLVNDLRAEAREILLFYAQMVASAATTETTSNLNFIFEQIIQRTNFPIVMTDAEDNPIAWKGIEVDPDDHSPEAVAEVRRIMEVMKKEGEPIPITYEGQLLNNLYYGDSRLIKQLQWLPYIEIAVVGLFVLIGFAGFRSIKRSEEQFIWVGMSKETAHQIGTPLSSIMGWLELLKEKVRDPDAQNTLAEMEKDVARLQKVTARFSQIGSRAELKRINVASVIEEVVNYFQRRLPQWGKKVRIEPRFQAQPEVMLNKDLFEWVLEKKKKNALDSIERERGNIQIEVGTLQNGKHRVYIDITDNGRGIESSKKGHIFKPGFSTKKRGWGLGLSLAKRIVEDYHGGKLVLKESKVGAGTTMRILLNA